MISDLADGAEPSALLIDEEKAAGKAAPPADETRAGEAPPSELAPPLGGSLIDGKSALLIGAEEMVRPTAPKVPVGRARGRRRSERVKVVTPKAGAEVEWYSNAEACVTYCRKHRRPLLLYFTTGDAEACETYEEAIRRSEMLPFLCQYVCCMVNMGEAEGRQAAVRLGVPTDGPAMVLLAPSGREWARVLKAEVDWQFLATMLFWALR